MSATRLFFTTAEAAYFLASITFVIYYLTRGKGFRVAATCLLVAGALSQALFIAWRWGEAGRPPFANTFETLVFFSLVIAVVCIVLELLYSPKIVGAGGALLALLAVGYANLFEWQIEPLMPALQNNFWLTLHVVFCFISYGSFAMSFVAALIFLLMHGGALRKISAFLLSICVVGLVGGLFYAVALAGMPIVAIAAGGAVVAALFSFALGYILTKRGVTAEGRTTVLSDLVWKMVAFGFPFLTLGIMTGSVWASVAWGRYWGWDPKETWSLITWLVYAFFLHVRFSGGLFGLKAKSLPQLQAILSVIGFLFVLFTYFGVNYLLSGLHAYT
jgi:cytochrome c-type biogenesis protein CcsB